MTALGRVEFDNALLILVLELVAGHFLITIIAVTYHW